MLNEALTNTEEISDTQAANFQNQAHCENLAKEITQLAGHINAMNYEFLKLLREFDEHGGWQVDGVKSFPHWLNWKCGCHGCDDLLLGVPGGHSRVAGACGARRDPGKGSVAVVPELHAACRTGRAGADLQRTGQPGSTAVRNAG